MMKCGRLMTRCGASTWLVSLAIAGGGCLVSAWAAEAEKQVQAAEGVAIPRVFDNGYELTLFATEPQVVTPVGATLDRRGRLLVIESHTHFPPESYTGPKSDRIRWLIDSDDDGRADDVRTFYEGTRATMSLRRGPDNWIYVATRRDVFRLRDKDGDDVADERQEIVRLETAGDYPHNGLCGLAFDGRGGLYFGLGENLGEPYTLIASDGTKWNGGGEGGNVFHVTAEGKEVRRVATGFWNPFGMCVDSAGRLFAVENDPDGSPPCRLLHVVETGDYGFQFRYGRSGKHPLQAWNGELPGTLPMVAGTGEAPCAVLPHRGQLWVTSWGENRIERFSLKPEGASWTASRDIVLQGDHEFRPVDFAAAPDGTLFFTDWVDRSYPVHGRGRVWRLREKRTSGVAARREIGEDRTYLKLTAAERQAEEAAARVSQTGDPAAFLTDDPFLRQAIVHGLSMRLKRGEPVVSQDKVVNVENDGARLRLAILQARRWVSDAGEWSAADRNELASMLDRAAAHGSIDDGGNAKPALPDDAELVFALRWMADRKATALQSNIGRLLEAPNLSPRVYRSALAAFDWLERGEVAREYRAQHDERLIRTAMDDGRPAGIRELAIRLASPTAPIDATALESLARGDSDRLAREATRLLALRVDDEAARSLESLAADDSLEDGLRADAVVGLAARAESHESLLRNLSQSEAKDVAYEARRALLVKPETAPSSERRPSADDIDGWMKRLLNGLPGTSTQSTGPKSRDTDVARSPIGDADAGWRVFFGAKGGRCAACHSFGGRGGSIGPDLTGIGSKMGVRRVLQSILEPSREIAPTYQPFTIEMDDGRVISGLSLGRLEQDKKERIVGTDGRETVIEVQHIEARSAGSTSIMPQGLEEGLTDDDLRNVLQLLMASEEN